VIPDWEHLQKIRKLPLYAFAKWTVVLVPVMASAALFVDQQWKIKFAFPVNMLVLYASSLCFFIASLVVDFLCPEVIKEHQNFDNFLTSSAKRADVVADVRRRVAEHQTPLLDELAMEIQKSSGSNQSGDRTTMILARLVSEEIPNAFIDTRRPTWRERNQWYRVARILVTTFFVLAALLALYVSLYDAPRRVIRAVV
jgi:hypothetical protein